MSAQSSSVDSSKLENLALRAVSVTPPTPATIATLPPISPMLASHMLDVPGLRAAPVPFPVGFGWL